MYPCMQDVNPARSASPLPGGAVRSSGRDRKPVKEFITATPTAELDTSTAITNHNHHTTSTAATTASSKRSLTTATTTTSSRKPSLSSGPSSPTAVSASSSPKRPRQFDEVTGEELFCICRQPYDSRRFMIGCDECDGWFHAKCVNLSKAEAEASKQWKCPDCAKRGGGAASVKVAAEGRRRAGKSGKNGKRKDVDGGDEDEVADELSNGMNRNKENHPAVKEERREDELAALDDSVGGTELVRVMAADHNGGADSGSVAKAAKSDKSREKDRANASKASSNSKDKTSSVKSEKVDKLQKAKRRRDKEDKRDKSATSAITNDGKDRRREAKRSERDTSANSSSSSTVNGLAGSGKRRDRDEDDSKKRRRVDRDDGGRHADGKSERRRDRDRERTIVPGVVSDSELSEADEARYSWLDKDERDSSSGEEDVYMTSEDEAAEAEADDVDIDGVLIEREESANFDDWRRSGLSERKTMEEDEEESALDALSVKPLLGDEQQRDVVPFGSLSLRARTLLSPFSMSAGENTREVFLSALLPDNDSASLSFSSLSSSTSLASVLSTVSPSTSPSSSTSAADFTMSSPPSVDDLDHLHLHRLHNAKMRVECELLRLEQDRRVYLAGVDYSARMSVRRTMEAFDRRATESVLLEEVEVDEESTKEKERERERQEAEAAGRGAMTGTAGGGGMDVMSSPRVVFPFTPRPPSLSRRPSTNSLTSLPSFSLASDAISPPLYGTTLTCCGCDGLIPVNIYHQHLLDCAMSAQEAGQQDWIHEAMTYISGQWEEGRPIGGGQQRKKVSAEYNGNLAGAVVNEGKRKERVKGVVAAAERGGGDERVDGRIDRTTASERQSEKERQRIQQREAAYNRHHLKSNPTPVGTAANRIQGLLPLPPLLHPYPTTPLIRPLRQRTVAATRHSADWERDRERQQEREDELRREERRRGTKHDKHNLSLNSVSGRFPLQLSHLRLVCGYPMPSSRGGQQYVYCSREKRDCTAHLLWEEVEKVRVEQRYWQLSRRLEMLKAELEPVQFRVSERVMCEADVIGQVLGDSILVEEAEDENMKEEAERMVVLVQRRREEEHKRITTKVERDKEEMERKKTATTVNSVGEQKRATTAAPPAATAAAVAVSPPSVDAAKVIATISPAIVEAKKADRRSSTDMMDLDEHEGFAMSTSVTDVDHSSPTHHHVLPPVPRTYLPSPAILNSPYGWMGSMPAPVRALPHFYAMEPTAAVFVAAGYGSGQHASATLPPPPPTHPQPLRVQTAGLGSPVSSSPSGLTTVMGSSSSGSAFSPPGRGAAAVVDSASVAAVDGGGAGSARSSSSTPSSSSSSSSPTASLSAAPSSSPSKSTTSSVPVVPLTSLPLPPPPPPLPVQATLAINANPTIPRTLAPVTLVSPNSLQTHAIAAINGTNSSNASSDRSFAAVDGGSKHMDSTVVGQHVVAQPAIAAVAT